MVTARQFALQFEFVQGDIILGNILANLSAADAIMGAACSSFLLPKLTQRVYADDTCGMVYGDFGDFAVPRAVLGVIPDIRRDLFCDKTNSLSFKRLPPL